MTITAGPRGVLVVGRDNFYPPHHHGAYVWHSADGRSFSTMTRVSAPADELPPEAVAQATPSGFLLGMSYHRRQILLTSEDGV